MADRPVSGSALAPELDAAAADPGDDHRRSADYKRAVVRVLTHRAAASALARAREAS